MGRPTGATTVIVRLSAHLSRCRNVASRRTLGSRPQEPVVQRRDAGRYQDGAPSAADWPGCGGGSRLPDRLAQLPMAARVRLEPDMLQRARRAAGQLDSRNVTWMIGADTDIPALRGLLGDNSVAHAICVFRSGQVSNRA